MTLGKNLAKKTNEIARLDHSLGTSTGSEPFPYFKPLGTEKLPIKEGPTILKKRNIYSGGKDSFVLGHPTNGVLGTANGVGGNQIVLGDQSDEWITERVVNPNNTWREMLRTTTFKDTATTTGTWDTSTYKLEFGDGDVIQTETIYTDDSTLASGRLNIAAANISLGSGATLTYYLSPDGGSNWETVTNETIHSFTNSGSDLKLKISCSGGTAEIAIEDSDGYTTPIRVRYWTS